MLIYCICEQQNILAYVNIQFIFQTFNGNAEGIFSYEMYTIRFK